MIPEGDLYRTAAFLVAFDVFVNREATLWAMVVLMPLVGQWRNTGWRRQGLEKILG